jgi:hypothetical protein
MKRIAILLLAGLTGAVAQPAPTESVTVTGERTREEQICPAVAGLKPELIRFVVQRLKTIAAKVGAPVNPHASCRTNVEIVFTPAPQALLDNVRKNQEDYLGYHANAAQAARLARVTHAVQAWYATGTIDSNGSVQADLKRRGMPFCMDEPECRIVTDVPPSAVTGSRLNNGLHSGFLNVIIVANRGKLLDQEIGAVADYISVLALSQPGSLDDCAALPSILNLLASGCAGGTAPIEISAADENYLRGLYRMTPDALLTAQRGEIAYQMKQTMGGR